MSSEEYRSALRAEQQAEASGDVPSPLHSVSLLSEAPFACGYSALPSPCCRHGFVWACLGEEIILRGESERGRVWEGAHPLPALCTGS